MHQSSINQFAYIDGFTMQLILQMIVFSCDYLFKLLLCNYDCCFTFCLKVEFQSSIFNTKSQKTHTSLISPFTKQRAVIHIQYKVYK